MSDAKVGWKVLYFFRIGALDSFLIKNKFPLVYKLKIRLSKPNLKQKIGFFSKNFSNTFNKISWGSTKEQEYKKSGY